MACPSAMPRPQRSGELTFNIFFSWGALRDPRLWCCTAMRCEEVKQPESPSSKGLEIHVPGVDLTLDKEKGLHIQAGETEVTANKKEGVNVKALGVDVEIDAKREKSGDQ